MELLFIPVGGLFAVVYSLLALFRTLRRRTELDFTDMLLAFMTALVLLAGLVINSIDGIADSRVEIAVLVMAAALMVFGLMLVIIELFRPQRLKQSRGVLTIGVALLLAFSGIFVPFAGAYFSLPPRSDATVSETVAPGQPTPDPGAEFLTVFNQVIQVIADTTGLSFDEVLASLDNGQTVASLVATNQGDLDVVIADITTIMQDFLRKLVAENRVDRLRATAGIAGMEIVVRYAVNNDLSTLRRAGEEEIGVTAEATLGEGTPKPSFFSFLTASATLLDDVEVTGIPATMTVVTPTPTLIILPSVTPFPTSEATATRTPRPSPTATNTRERYVTRTPTLTPTLPSPCLAMAEFNINLREKPALDATLLV
ncbi:MAG: hypothetical protein H7X77_03400, partial [Anaerolineae bacterium]|nr:hypothetical protein [Anaerolineae bacterium]